MNGLRQLRVWRPASAGVMFRALYFPRRWKLIHVLANEVGPDPNGRAILIGLHLGLYDVMNRSPTMPNEFATPNMPRLLQPGSLPWVTFALGL